MKQGRLNHIGVATTQILPGTGRCPAGAEGSRLSSNAASAARGDPSVSSAASHPLVQVRICVAAARAKHYNDLIM